MKRIHCSGWRCYGLQILSIKKIPWSFFCATMSDDRKGIFFYFVSLCVFTQREVSSSLWFFVFQKTDWHMWVFSLYWENGFYRCPIGQLCVCIFCLRRYVKNTYSWRRHRQYATVFSISQKMCEYFSNIYFEPWRGITRELFLSHLYIFHFFEWYFYSRAWVPWRGGENPWMRDKMIH